MKTIVYFDKLIVVLIFILTLKGSVFGQTVDPKIPTYKIVPGLSGNLSSVGSDTLNNLMTLWSEDFHKLYPNVNVQVEGKGSATAPPALSEGVAQLGPMSRAMKREEIVEFKNKHGFEPSRIEVALDALAVFVNKNNPLTEISLPEIDAIFSSTLNSGSKSITDWGELISSAGWKNRLIRLYGRNSASGTYGYFKSVALYKGDFKNSVKERPGSAAVVQSVSEDQFGIGYSGMGYITSNVKALKIKKTANSQAVEPKYENVLSSDYVLGRALYIYFLKDPNQPLDRLTSEFLKFVLSKKGQETVVKDGYLPLPAGMAAKSVDLLH